MAIRRFYCDPIGEGSVTLSDDQAAHARKSLRLNPGDVVELYDGHGGIATGEITELTRTMVVRVRELSRSEPLLPAIDLAVAIPKGPRADSLIDAVSQLGADRLIPLVTDYSVVEPGANKLTRFERIASESAKQCRRPYLMKIDGLTKAGPLIDRDDYDLKLLADVRGISTEKLLADASTPQRARRLLLLVGPEGGWSDAERQHAAQAGCVSWCFGPHVLRVETAATAGLAVLRAMTQTLESAQEIQR